MENEELNHQKRLMEGLDSRIHDIKNCESEEVVDPLAITESIEVDIELSTGGPSDGFKIYLEKETREPIFAFYYFSDWGWYKERWLRSDEIDLIVDYFNIC